MKTGSRGLTHFAHVVLSELQGQQETLSAALSLILEWFCFSKTLALQPSKATIQRSAMAMISLHSVDMCGQSCFLIFVASRRKDGPHQIGPNWCRQWRPQRRHGGARTHGSAQRDLMFTRCVHSDLLQKSEIHGVKESFWQRHGCILLGHLVKTQPRSHFTYIVLINSVLQLQCLRNARFKQLLGLKHKCLLTIYNPCHFFEQLRVSPIRRPIPRQDDPPLKRPKTRTDTAVR